LVCKIGRAFIEVASEGAQSGHRFLAQGQHRKTAVAGAAVDNVRIELAVRTELA
jgi:hypothetical protein